MKTPMTGKCGSPTWLMLWNLTLMCCVALLAMTCCGRAGVEALDPNPDPPAEAGRNFKVIHAFVALCDNASQGIAPVPQKIGNGDDPANNLYWGCTDGARSIFSASGSWKRLGSFKVNAQPEILERLVFQHEGNHAILVIDGWRGSSMKTCVQQFCQAIAGQRYESLTIKTAAGISTVNIAGGADFIAFIGHNGLMDFQMSQYPANPKRKQHVDAAVLCCKSKDYFGGYLAKAGAQPAVMTASNMYPGAFILRDVLDGWFAKEGHAALRERAAKAYAKNQNISTKSALNVFAQLP